MFTLSKSPSRVPRIAITFLLVTIAAIMVLALNKPALSCDVAVVSGKYTTDGRPVIWKNYDCSADWNQEVKYFKAKNATAGDYMLLYHDDDYMTVINNSPVMPQSGANAAGFAISTAAVYEDLAPAHEAGNLNTDLVQDAVEKCGSLADFESLLKTWPRSHLNHPISANYVVVDAQGGAALYECYTGKLAIGLMYIQYRKYDANTGKVTDQKGNTVMEAPADHPGFINRTNLNNYVWYNSGVDRYLRAKDLLSGLAVRDSATGKTRLNAQNLMQVVAKDVVGKQAEDNGDTYYSTTYCISRSQTRSGTVFQGVKAGDDPRKSVYWTALGEPSVSVFVPNMVGAGSVSDYVIMDTIDSNGLLQDKSDNALLTIAEDELEISAGVHTNNRGSVTSGPYNKYIDKTALARVQDWTFPIENTVIAKTNEFLRQLDSNPDLVTEEYLQSFTNYCGKYIYQNYVASSAVAVPWTFVLSPGDIVDPIEDPVVDPVNPGDDPADDTIAVDKSVLRALIMAAETNKTGPNVSQDGTDVVASEQWVSPQELATYQEAINKASAVSLDLFATQAEVDQAVADMEAANQAFQNAKEPGTKQGVTLNGRVQYKGGFFSLRKSVEGAKVYIVFQGKTYETYSDAKGYYTLKTDLPIGTYKVYCSHPTYGELVELETFALINYKDFLYTK